MTSPSILFHCIRARWLRPYALLVSAAFVPACGLGTTVSSSKRGCAVESICRDTATASCVGRNESSQSILESTVVVPRNVRSFPSPLATKKCGTTTSADFCSHESGHPGRPAFQAKPYSWVRPQLSPNKGRDLSLPKLLIYLRSFFRFGFAVSSPLAWSRRPPMRFLFVTWQVLARRSPARAVRWLIDHLRRLPLHGLSPRRSCPRLVLSLRRTTFGILRRRKKPELSTGDSHPTRSRPCWAY
ncbi:hypothetical protein Poly21_22310 [Allorhodopirellula heiligendammensis]|uniref:Uncharacterized protein n=1 Tax=Allorhodopirellula heiligendammensis TaxID=2714739 RepID=A0A5C6C5Z3_9BACT|nr:hypothetical protein Poly21_22310 [Allorhodopirellula heiligendammensis]